MLTDTDIKKLKKIFATKDDLKRFATKDDLRQFSTKDDLKQFATKEALVDLQNELVKTMTELIDALYEKIKIDLQEMKLHRIVLGEHEKRIQRLEEKSFSSL